MDGAMLGRETGLRVGREQRSSGCSDPRRGGAGRAQVPGVVAVTWLEYSEQPAALQLRTWYW
jgi:hypothetical protein